MAAVGHTTVIKQVLERRLHNPATHEDTTATIAVMLRVLPPPRALLVIRATDARAEFAQRIRAEMLDVTPCEDRAALESLQQEYRPIVICDSLELVRAIRERQLARTPHVIYVLPEREPAATESALLAGADDCLDRHASERELHARISSARRIAELEEVLRIALVENRKLSTTDDLTRVASRRFFGKHFPREVERAARYRRPVSLILCDIDFFKRVNDTFGHAGGDEVLKAFSTRLQESLRRGVDWVARLGGEEFAVILPETGYEQALDVARRLRERIADEPFHVHGCNHDVTASFGLCSLHEVPPGERRIADHMLRVADVALYRSKHAGRNRVTATLMPARVSTPPTNPFGRLGKD